MLSAGTLERLAYLGGTGERGIGADHRWVDSRGLCVYRDSRGEACRPGNYSRGTGHGSGVVPGNGSAVLDRETPPTRTRGHAREPVGSDIAACGGGTATHGQPAHAAAYGGEYTALIL